MRFSGTKCRLERTPEFARQESFVCADEYEVHEVLHTGTRAPNLPISPCVCVDLFGNVLRQWNRGYLRRVHVCKFQQSCARQQIRRSCKRVTKADINHHVLEMAPGKRGVDPIPDCSALQLIV